MDSEYFDKLKEAFLDGSKRSYKPLLAPSPLFNMPYREVRDFMYLYGRFKHNVFSTFHNVKVPVELVSDLNTSLRVAVQKNQDLAQAIHSVLEKHSDFLDGISTETHKRQHLPKLKSTKSNDGDGFFKNLFEFLLIPIEILIAFLGSK